MQISRCPLSTKTRPSTKPPQKAWNSGVKVGKKRPLTPKHATQIRKYLQRHDSLRNQALFMLGYDCALRSSDIRKLTIGNVLYSGGAVRTDFTIIQKKTGQEVKCVISRATRKLLARWIKENGGKWSDPLFPGRTKDGTLGLKQHQRLIKQWVSAIGLNTDKYSSHTMRRTKASIIYAKSKNLEYVRLILGQRTIAAAAHYLGVAVEQALAFSQKMSMKSSVKEAIGDFFQKHFFYSQYADQFVAFPRNNHRVSRSTSALSR